MVFLDPLYLALGVFAIFVIATVITTSCIKKVRNRRRFGNRRQPTTSDVNPDAEANHHVYDGPVNLYEAKPSFEYDPDLLVILLLYTYLTSLLILFSHCQGINLLRTQGQMD